MAEEIFTQAIEVYLARTALRGEPPHPVLEKMRIRGTERHFPIVGPEVGRFFRQIAAIRRPKRILELGSGFGYSAVWWAMGCPQSEIHLTDFDQANLDEARQFAEEAGVIDQFTFHAGDALDNARKLQGPWDIIFCDINKQLYPAAIDFAETVLRPGDLLLFDNMLWHGRVVEPIEKLEDPGKGVLETTRRLYEDEKWMTSLLPIRDGVIMSVRC